MVATFATCDIWDIEELSKVLGVNPMLGRVIEWLCKEDEGEDRQAKGCSKESIAYFREASKGCMESIFSLAF